MSNHKNVNLSIRLDKLSGNLLLKPGESEDVADAVELLGTLCWQPIETAPKDGTLIDVSCISPIPDDKTRIRLTDVSWYNADDIFPYTGWMRIVDDGNFDLVDDSACCRYGLPRWIPTHWMPLPLPPGDVE